MTTTIELPNDLFARAEQTAKARGITTSAFIADAVANHAEPDPTVRARVIAAAIELAALREENLRILQFLDEDRNGRRAPQDTEKHSTPSGRDKQEAAA